MPLASRFMVTACLAVLAASTSSAQPEPNTEAVGPSLPPTLRALLIEEMLAVLDASGNILDALVRGQDARVAENAQAIHDSFIMAQQMTDADRETLRTSVPRAFLERDEAFHELSAELAESARNGDRPRQRELFAQLIDACVDCHSAHASNRFPELASQ